MLSFLFVPSLGIVALKVSEDFLVMFASVCLYMWTVLLIENNRKKVTTQCNDNFSWNFMQYISALLKWYVSLTETYISLFVEIENETSIFFTNVFAVLHFDLLWKFF